MDLLDAAQWGTPDAYHAAREAATQRAERWQWTDGPRYDPRPYFFQRQNLGRGRRLNGEPADKSDCWQYGFDAQGRVVIERYFDLDDGVGETFFTYQDGQTEGVSYHRSAEGAPLLRNVTRSIYENGLLARYDLFTPETTPGQLYTGQLACRYREHYAYQEGRLIRLRIVHLGGRKRFQEIVETFVYDPVGRLDYIHREDSEASDAYIIYQRPIPGQTLSWLRETVKERLLVVVPRAAAAMLPPEDRLFCLALIYDLDDENCLPPALMLGTDDARTMLIQDYGSEVADFLWDPDEFGRYGPPAFPIDEDDELLAEVSFLLNQQLSFLNGWTMVRDLLNEVARDLMALDWSDYAAVTPDFVVYATDVEMEDFDDNFAFSVPAEQVASLTAEGLF